MISLLGVLISIILVGIRKKKLILDVNNIVARPHTLMGGHALTYATRKCDQKYRVHLIFIDIKPKE